MINSNELRVGNWVLLNRGTDDKTEVTIDIITIYEDENAILLKKCDPIPLTEDWLKRFGFKRQNNAWNGPHQNDFSLWNPKGETEFTLNDTVLCPRIDYVHQLQNLYYALTGKELLISKKEKE